MTIPATPLPLLNTPFSGRPQVTTTPKSMPRIPPACDKLSPEKTQVIAAKSEKNQPTGYSAVHPCLTIPSSSDRNARTVCEHARGDVHGRQLLEQQFGGIGNEYLGDPGLVLAGSALERLLGKVSVVWYISILDSKTHRNGRAEKTYAIGVMSPQISQMWTRNASDTSNSRSLRNAAAP